MGVLQHVARVVVVPAVALALVAAGTGTAAANDFGLAVHAEGHMHFYTTPDDSYLKVCFIGHVEQPSSRIWGTWNLTIKGHRGPEPFTVDWTSNEFDVSECEFIYKHGFETGSFTVDWSYTAVGSYIYARDTGGGLWDPHTGNQFFSVRT